MTSSSKERHVLQMLISQLQKACKFSCERMSGCVVGRITPKDVHGLIPRTCDYITLSGKRVFADMIKDLNMGELSSVVLTMGSYEGRVRVDARKEPEAEVL